MLPHPVLVGLTEGATVEADERAWRRIQTGGVEDCVAAEYLADAPPVEEPSGHFSAEQVAAGLGALPHNAERHLPAITAALNEFGIGDRATTIAALTTIGVEPGSFASRQYVAR
jgi:hypothetical protein